MTNINQSNVATSVLIAIFQVFGFLSPNQQYQSTGGDFKH